MKVMARVWTLVVVAGVVFASLGMAGRAHAAGTKRPVQLQVQVIMPASMSAMNPMRVQDVEDAFADRLATALHEQGFHGRVGILYDTDDPVAGIPLLTASLMEWRVDPTGSVNCTFTAQLRTPQGERSLGLFTGTSIMMWPEHDWFARADQFTEAAGNAMNDLWKRMQETGLLGRPAPGARR